MIIQIQILKNLNRALKYANTRVEKRSFNRIKKKRNQLDKKDNQI